MIPLIVIAATVVGAALLLVGWIMEYRVNADLEARLVELEADLDEYETALAATPFPPSTNQTPPFGAPH